jgi:hypothetical protein
VPFESHSVTVSPIWPGNEDLKTHLKQVLNGRTVG